MGFHSSLSVLPHPGVVLMFPVLFLQVLQDFELLFGEETSSKLLGKWEMSLKTKIIEEAKNLTKSPMLESLIHAAEGNPDTDGASELTK